MKNLLKIKTHLVVAVLMISLSSFALKTNFSIAYDPSGVWDYTVPTEEGDLTGQMTISKEDNEWKVIIKSDVYGTLDLSAITLTETEDKEVYMEGNVDIEGDIITFYFEFEGDNLEGTVGTPDGDLDITAERQKKK